MPNEQRFARDQRAIPTWPVRGGHAQVVHATQGLTPQAFQDSVRPESFRAVPVEDFAGATDGSWGDSGSAEFRGGFVGASPGRFGHISMRADEPNRTPGWKSVLRRSTHEEDGVVQFMPETAIGLGMHLQDVLLFQLLALSWNGVTQGGGGHPRWPFPSPPAPRPDAGLGLELPDWPDGWVGLHWEKEWRDGDNLCTIIVDIEWWGAEIYLDKQTAAKLKRALEDGADAAGITAILVGVSSGPAAVPIAALVGVLAVLAGRLARKIGDAEACQGVTINIPAFAPLVTTNVDSGNTT